MNYYHCVLAIRRRTRCSLDEAWEGLNEAFLTLSQDFTEAQQCSYLIKVGCFNVTGVVRKKYLDKDGTLREQPDDFETVASTPDDEWRFLQAFPAGMVRDFAESLASGTSKFTLGGASHFLRTKFNINRRTATKELYETVQRVAAERLL